MADDRVRGESAFATHGHDRQPYQHAEERRERRGFTARISPRATPANAEWPMASEKKAMRKLITCTPNTAAMGVNKSRPSKACCMKRVCQASPEATARSKNKQGKNQSWAFPFGLTLGAEPPAEVKVSGLEQQPSATGIPGAGNEAQPKQGSIF